MEITLDINRDTCTCCGRCVKVCPAKIFSQSRAGEVVEITNKASCIVCGHCAAACPVGAIEHSEFPEDKIHQIDYSQMPTPEQVMLLCRVRRSNRAFTSKAVPDEYLKMIVEAAHRAPTASNSQQVEFTVVNDPEKLKQIIGFTIGVFDSMLKKINNPILRPIVRRFMPGVYRYVPIFDRLKREYANGNDGILRHATTVMFIHTPKSNRFGTEDSNLVYQNGSLMAESLGVSQIYMGFVMSAIKQDKGGELNRLLGINGEIHAAMALGMPAFRYPNYVDKKDVVSREL